MEEVEYKPIQGFPGYMIGNDGTILSSKRSKGYIKTFTNPKGYYFAYLYKDNKRHILALHRLVAIHFIENPNNYLCVNHKDENPANNHYSNLEWCSYSYNRSYGTCEDRRTKALSKYFKVAQYSSNGDFIKVWDNCSIAGRALGMTNGNCVNYCALHPWCKSKGFYWRKVKNNIIEPHIDIVKARINSKSREQCKEN